MGNPKSTNGKFLSRIAGQGIETSEPKSVIGKLLKTIASKLEHEEWVFTLDDGTTVTKEVLVWNTED